jgi:hypothetical protein
MKKYREIEFSLGGNIETAVAELKSQSGLVCGTFNGQVLYSDIDDMDSAYKKITGKTKAEFDEAQRQSQERYEKEKIEHEESIPELTKEWIEKGLAVLDRNTQDWIECVPIRLGDLYRGMELGASLEIIKELNSGCELEAAKVIIDGQGHSGMSYGLVCSMIKHFCDRGNEFVKYLNNK